MPPKHSAERPVPMPEPATVAALDENEALELLEWSYTQPWMSGEKLRGLLALHREHEAVLGDVEHEIEEASVALDEQIEALEAAVKATRPEPAAKKGAKGAKGIDAQIAALALAGATEVVLTALRAVSKKLDTVSERLEREP